MKKYYVVSDIHSFYTYLKEGLDKAGFDVNDNDHILIVCGDIFDRGDETLEVYNFLKSLPKSRRILIKGNHEQLYLDLLESGCYGDMPSRYDYSNGTVKTFCHIAGVDYEELKKSLSSWALFRPLWQKVLDGVLNSPITKWLRSDDWKDYYELDNYIFVHSFIPLRIKDIPETQLFKEMGLWQITKVDDDYLEVVPNWRTEAGEFSWSDARWGCPWKWFKAGLFDEEKSNGKTLVCGHWHASEFYQLDGEQHDITKGEMYNNHGLIGLDACTVLSKKVNVYIIEK